MAQLIPRNHRATGFHETTLTAIGDDQDAVASAAVSRLDDEGLVLAQQRIQLVDRVLGANHPIQRGHRDACAFGQFLGLQFVVNQRIKAACVVEHDEISVTLIHRQNAGLAQDGARPAHYGSLPVSTARKRQNSDSR